MPKKAPIFVLIAILALAVISIVILWYIQKPKPAPWPQNIFRQSDDIDFDKLATTSLALRLDEVLEQTGPRPDLDMVEQREFDIYLERPDQNLKQPEQISGDVFTPDLRPELRPVRLLISDPDDRARDSGNSCLVGSFPHRCTLHLSAKEQGRPKTVLVKVVFADKFYAEKELVVPYAGMLKDPIILEPKAAPQSGEAIHFKFKDVGAEEYEVAAHICHPYRNDGVNPCLKGRGSYTISRQGDSFAWRYLEKEKTPPQENITAKNGTVDIILPAKYDFSDEDTSVVYRVIATLAGETDDGVKTFLTSNASLELKK